jgi:hypothetical protein
MIATLKRAIDSLMETLIDRIVLFTDYFIVQKHITLSETAMFAFSLSWTLWFVFVGVYVSEMALSRAIWATLFAMTTIAHFCSFFFKDIVGRAFVACAYAFVWCFLTLLSAYTGSVAPAVPTLFVFTFLSVFIAVRLFRERQQGQ